MTWRSTRDPPPPPLSSLERVPSILMYQFNLGHSSQPPPLACVVQRRRVVMVENMSAFAEFESKGDHEDSVRHVRRLIL